MLLVLVAGAAIGFVTWLALGRPFTRDPVTKAQIEHAVAQRPTGHVQFVLCNEEVLPSPTQRRNAPQTWTCDTYLGQSKQNTQNGPSYLVLVSDDHIRSIRRVPTH
jgi:hypothetical protein